MNAKYWLGCAAAAIGVTACAPGPLDASRCAKSSSVVSNADAAQLAQLNSQYANPRSLGGYIIATERTKDANGVYHETSFKCAGQMSLGLGTQQILVWTADHCIDYRKVRSLKFVPYNSSATVDGLGTYELNEGLEGAIAHLQKIRDTLKAVLSESAVDELMEKMMPTVDKAGEAACKQDYLSWSATHDPAGTKAYNRMCVSLEDLTLIAFDIPTNPTAEVQTLLAKLDERAASHPLSAQASATLQTWEGNYQLYMNQLFKLGSAVLLDAMRSCGSENPKASSELCSQKQAILYALDAFTKGWDPNAEIQVVKARVDERFADIKSAWDSTIGDLAAAQPRFHWSGNYVFGSESTVAYEFGPLKIPAKTAYLTLPDLFGLASGDTSKVNVSPLSSSLAAANVGAIFTRPANLVNLDFKPGDSGSLLMFKLDETAYLPVGVLSTVNGDPVSGGLAVRPAGTGESESEEGGDGGTLSSNPTTPGGTVVSQPGGANPCKS